MLKEELTRRNLPPLRTKEEMLETLLREEYGRMPPAPQYTIYDVQQNIVNRFCAGHASLHRVTPRCVVEGKPFSFPFTAAIPTEGEKHPFFIHINFRRDNPDRYMPTEELIDAGFAVLSFCYDDVSRDNDDFTDGLAGLLFPDGKRKDDDPGKIAMWAWGASRVLDWALTRPELDPARAIVCGHSRLGKTALLAHAVDERFAIGYSNDSGCSGAALARGTRGETVGDIVGRFHPWFCENYYKYAGRAEQLPFDQHWLIACAAPRPVLIGSALLDDWADPISEQLAALAAGEAFPVGLVCPDRPAQVGELLADGLVGYHLREGRHYFSRHDWKQLMAFARAKFGD